MASYYGDRSRDVPSWESFEAGGDDDVLDTSEVRPFAGNAWIAQWMSGCLIIPVAIEAE